MREWPIFRRFSRATLRPMTPGSAPHRRHARGSPPRWRCCCRRWPGMQYRLGQPARRAPIAIAASGRCAPRRRSSPRRSTPICRASAAACSSTARWSSVSDWDAYALRYESATANAPSPSLVEAVCGTWSRSGRPAARRAAGAASIAAQQWTAPTCRGSTTVAVAGRALTRRCARSCDDSRSTTAGRRRRVGWRPARTSHGRPTARARRRADAGDAGRARHRCRAPQRRRRSLLPRRADARLHGVSAWPSTSSSPRACRRWWPSTFPRRPTTAWRW